MSWNEKAQILYANGKWVSGPKCTSPLPIRNTATIICTARQCNEHIAAIFGPGDRVHSIWLGELVADGHEYSIARWGSVIEAAAREPAGPLSLHIDIGGQKVTRTRGGSSPCEWTLR
jgi:hypothetical protein